MKEDLIVVIFEIIFVLLHQSALYSCSSNSKNWDIYDYYNNCPKKEQ